MSPKWLGVDVRVPVVAVVKLVERHSHQRHFGASIKQDDDSFEMLVVLTDMAFSLPTNFFRRPTPHSMTGHSPNNKQKFTWNTIKMKKKTGLNIQQRTHTHTHFQPDGNQLFVVVEIDDKKRWK